MFCSHPHPAAPCRPPASAVGASAMQLRTPPAPPLLAPAGSLRFQEEAVQGLHVFQESLSPKSETLDPQVQKISSGSGKSLEFRV